MAATTKSVKQWKCSGCGHLSTDPGIWNSCKGYCYDSTGESCNAIPCPECGAVHEWTGAGFAEEPTEKPQRRCPICTEGQIECIEGADGILRRCPFCLFVAEVSSWDQVEELRAKMTDHRKGLMEEVRRGRDALDFVQGQLAETYEESDRLREELSDMKGALHSQQERAEGRIIDGTPIGDLRREIRKAVKQRDEARHANDLHMKACERLEGENERLNFILEGIRESLEAYGHDDGTHLRDLVERVCKNLEREKTWRQMQEGDGDEERLRAAEAHVRPIVEKWRQRAWKAEARVRELEEQIELSGGVAGERPTPDQVRRCGIFSNIEEERHRQDDKWGGPDHDDQHHPADWPRFISEHNRRVLACERDNDPEGYRRQLVRVAALAVAALESNDRLKARAAEPEPAVSFGDLYREPETGDVYKVMGFFDEGETGHTTRMAALSRPGRADSLTDSCERLVEHWERVEDTDDEEEPDLERFSRWLADEYCEHVCRGGCMSADDCATERLAELLPGGGGE